MGLLRGLSANEQDRLLAGHAPHADAQLEEVASFMRSLRVSLPAQPEHAEAALIRRLAETARTANPTADTDRATVGAGSRGRARSRLTLVARAGVAVALIPAMMAGLAFAGVSLPNPAQSAFDRVGIDLPNQAGGESDLDDGATAPAGTRDGVSGEGNSSAAHQNALEQRKKARGKAIGHTRGKAIGLNEATPPGKSGETGPPEHSSAGGSSSSTGSARSQSAPGKVKPTLPPKSRGRGAGRGS